MGAVSNIFSTQIRYGWLLDAAPTSAYNGGAHNMAIIIAVLGGALIIILSFFLFRILRAKKQSDLLSREKSNLIAIMQNNMKIGFFFMNQNYVIQNYYSRYMEYLLSEKNLGGKLFTDIISESVTPDELESIKDYFRMVLERKRDPEMLDDVNPLKELRYVNVKTSAMKVFHCAFATAKQTNGEIFLLVTVYDITARIGLEHKLAEEEYRRQKETEAVFELVQVQQDVFSDFMEDMAFEFDSIDKILKHDEMSAREALIKVYQSVHAIKSNAEILGLNIFGAKVHNLESKIKTLCEMEGEVPFMQMLNLTMDIEKVSREREWFRDIINKLKSYAVNNGGKRQNIKVLVDSLAKAANRAAEGAGKQVMLIADDIQPEAIENGPRRIIKEILMQLVRNSAVHGVETPDIRKARGKNETGVIKVSIRLSEDNQHIKLNLSDDGKGLDYKMISERAVSQNIIKKENVNNKNLLIKAIFAPGFSTADAEGIHTGRGIGLNLVRDRVKEVNGTISLHSEAGRGIVFFISIPVVKKQE